MNSILIYRRIATSESNIFELLNIAIQCLFQPFTKELRACQFNILNIKINLYKLKHIPTSLDLRFFHCETLFFLSVFICYPENLFDNASHPKLEHMMMMIAVLFPAFALLGFPMVFLLLTLPFFLFSARQQHIRGSRLNK